MLLRIVAAAFTHVLGPGPIAFGCRSGGLRFIANRGPHLGFHFAGMDAIGGHAACGQFGGEMTRELVESHLARAVGAVQGARCVKRRGGTEIDDPPPSPLDHAPTNARQVR